MNARKVADMVLNDTYSDIIARKVQLNLTWEDIARKMHTAYYQNVIDAAHRGNVPQGFIDLAAALDCDIEIALIPRKNNAGNGEN